MTLLEGLNTSLEADVVGLKEQLQTATEFGEAAEGENERLSHDIATLKFEKQQLITWHAELESAIKTFRMQQETIQTLAQLPETIPEVIEALEKLHPSAIEFTPQAKESAKQATFSDATIAWKLPWSMVTTLYDFYFNSPDERIDIVRRYKELSGFDLALNEGKDTTRNNKWMALRQQVYNGKTIDITPHVKYGNKPPKVLRVYYYADRERRRIVIGHCGDHLPNFSTAKV